MICKPFFYIDADTIPASRYYGLDHKYLLLTGVNGPGQRYNNSVEVVPMKTRSPVARWFNALCLSLALIIPQLSVADVVKQQPTALAMATDTVIVRPVMLAVTVVGTAFFLVSLPFSALGGNVGQAADTLMVQPAANTFLRCLGCTRMEYRERDED